MAVSWLNSRLAAANLSRQIGKHYLVLDLVKAIGPRDQAYLEATQMADDVWRNAVMLQREPAHRSSLKAELNLQPAPIT